MERPGDNAATKRFSLKRLFLGAFAGLVLTAVLCILFAAMVNGEWIPFRFLRGLAAAAVFFGALWSAIVGAGKGTKLARGVDWCF